MAGGASMGQPGHKKTAKAPDSSSWDSADPPAASMWRRLCSFPYVAIIAVRADRQANERRKHCLCVCFLPPGRVAQVPSSCCFTHLVSEAQSIGTARISQPFPR